MKRIIFMAFVFISFSSGAAFASASQEINLKAGFNFIAFTLKPSLYPSQFIQQYSSVEDIYSFNAASGSFMSVSEGTIAALNAGRGYIIKSKTADAIKVEGADAGPAGDIPMKAGFNLIGISRPVADLTFYALMAANASLRGLYKFHAPSGSFIQVVRNASGAVELLDGANPVFTAGQSYFFNMVSDNTINCDSGEIKLGPGYNMLSSIALSVNSGAVKSSSDFELSNVIVTASYSDIEAKTVTPVWTVKSGGGVVSATKYTPSGAAETVVLTAAYTEGPFTAYADFTLTVNSNPGLTGWWKFEEGAGTLINDSSGNYNFGFSDGGATFVAGVAGKAIKLDGSGSVLFQTTPSIDMVNDMTVSLWAKIDPASAPMGTIISKGHTAANGNHGWVFRVYSDTLKGEAEFFGGIDGKWQSVTFAGMNPPDNSWHLLTGVKSRSGMFAYVDGALRGSNPSAVNDFTSVSDFFLVVGADSANGGRFIKGVFDEVRVYNYALSAGEIQQYYNATKPAGTATYAPAFNDAPASAR
ncbi:MAG TPA: LamG domain-containing protein [Candidatus Wallbacteria bacterium]|nr:LamG domain-containing protein [Candidatus Wallbacteria bacterium]